jgi:hypothetical protein
MVFDPSFLYLSNCIFFPHFSSDLQKITHSFLNFRDIAFEEFSLLRESASFEVCFDKRRCRHNIFGPIGEKIVEKILRAHFEE